MNSPGCNAGLPVVCDNLARDYRLPGVSATVADGIAIQRYNMGLVFDCVKEYMEENVSILQPECRANWQDMFLFKLVHIIKSPRILGFHLYQEQIHQLATLWD